MAKRDHDESQFIKINPLTNSAESLISVAILNALVILEADKNPLVKIPTRKELTKLLRNAKFENVCKALDEVNGIRIRPVPNMESTGTAGIVQIDHPVKPIYCSVYRKGGETVEYLSKKGICISQKSACSLNNTPSKAVMAIYHDKKRALSSVRVSLSYLTTKDEINALIDALKEYRK